MKSVREMTEEVLIATKSRKYQAEAYDVAKNENIICVGPTGSGKTHIAGLLIDHLLGTKRKKLVVFFIVNKVILVHQQFKYLQAFFHDRGKKVPMKKYWGEKNIQVFWKRKKWSTELKVNEVLVMTSQILLNMLTHGFVRIPLIDLICFDECHHCTKDSPYRRIMRDFYFPSKWKGKAIPKIFGMTASPFSIGRKSVIGLNQDEMKHKLVKIQVNMDSTVKVLGNIQGKDGFVSREIQEELKNYVNEPKILRQDYSMVKLNQSTNVMKKFFIMLQKLEDLYKGKDHFLKFVSHCFYVLFELGSYGLFIFLGEVKNSLLGGKTGGMYAISREYEFSEVDEVVVLIESILEKMNFLEEHREIPSHNQLSSKVIKLIQVLEKYQEKHFRSHGNNEKFCALVFVERRNVAYCLHKMLERVKMLRMKMAFLCGHGDRQTSVRSFSKRRRGKRGRRGRGRRGGGSGLFAMKSTEQQELMSKFGKSINVIITTAVAEEGIDIQTCHLVIRFNLFKDLKSYTQSKGRARKKHSDFVILYNILASDDVALMDNIQKCEKTLIKTCIKGAEYRKYIEKDVDEKEGEFIVVEGTGAKVTLASALSHVAHYCSVLPTDMFTGKLRPRYYVSKVWTDKKKGTILNDKFEEFKFSSLNKLDSSDSNEKEKEEEILVKKSDSGDLYENFVCVCVLPNNSTINEKVIGAPYDSRRIAKQSAALTVVKMLYQRGLLNDHLLPISTENTKIIERNLEEQIEEVDAKYENLLEYERIVHTESLAKNFFGKNKVDCFLYGFKLGSKSGKTKEEVFPLGFLCAKKIDVNIPSFQVYYLEGKKTSCRYFYVGKMTLEKKLINLLKKYHCFLFEGVFKFKFSQWKNSSKFYLLFPMTQDLKVDWKRIIQTLRRMKLSKKSENESVEKNDIVKTLFSNTLYVVVGKSELTPKSNPNKLFGRQKTRVFSVKDLSGKRMNRIKRQYYFGIENFSEFDTYFRFQFPKYFKEKKINEKLKLLEVTQIPLQTNVLFKPLSQRRATRERKMFLPEDHVIRIEMNLGWVKKVKGMSGILWYFESYLIMEDFNKQLRYPLDLHHLRTAMTHSKTNEKYNYERLEFLGDSILKFIACQDLFFRFPDYHEGILSKKKYVMISNRFLYNKNLENKIFRFVFTEMFSPKLWKPTGFEIMRGKYGIRTRRKNVLSNKMLADVIESLVAVAYLSGGIEYSKYFLIDLGFPIKINTYSKYTPLKLKSPIVLELYQKFEVAKLEESLKYEFSNKTTIVQALTHQSYRNDEIRCYQRLEFFGDAVLDYIVTKYFYFKYGKIPPSDLSDLRGKAVSNELFAYVVAKEGFFKYLIFSSEKMEKHISTYVKEVNDNSAFDKSPRLVIDAPKILGDIFESIAAAIFIDSNYSVNAVKKVLLPIIRPYFDQFASLDTIELNPVRILTEMFQDVGICDFKLIQDYPNSKNGFKYSCVFLVHGLYLGYEESSLKQGARKKCAQKVIDIVKDNPLYLNAQYLQELGGKREDKTGNKMQSTKK